MTSHLNNTAERHLVAFGARVRELRVARGMTQLDLAAAADLHATYLSGVERGLRNISLLNIHALADALQVPAATLLSDPQVESDRA